MTATTTYMLATVTRTTTQLHDDGPHVDGQAVTAILARIPEDADPHYSAAQGWVAARGYKTEPIEVIARAATVVHTRSDRKTLAAMLSGLGLRGDDLTIALDKIELGDAFPACRLGP